MRLQIIHTNDLHNHFPGETIRKIMKPGALLLDSGDAIKGSNTVYMKKEPILVSMRNTGYHAMAMGNREFHYARKILLRRQEEAGFPLLSANVLDLSEKASIQDSLFWKEGLKIGIFGLTIPQYPVGSPWEKITGWRFLPPVKASQEISSRLREKGADLIFCLSHLGFSRDQHLAENVDGIDIIFGGHSHTLLKTVFWKNKTAIVQEGSHGRFVGNWWLRVDLQGGKVKSWKLEGEPIPSRHD